MDGHGSGYLPMPRLLFSTVLIKYVWVQSKSLVLSSMNSIHISIIVPLSIYMNMVLASSSNGSITWCGTHLVRNDYDCYRTKLCIQKDKF